MVKCTAQENDLIKYYNAVKNARLDQSRECFVISAGQAPEEELIYSLPGFSVQSGIKVGQAYQPPEVNQTDIQPLNVLFQSSIPGNNSQFTICLRLKAHYQRPETVLMSAYVENKTAILIGESIQGGHRV